MMAFAWCLWGAILFYFIIEIIVFIAAFISYGAGNDVDYSFNKPAIMILIAVFVFLTIYIHA